MLEEIWLIIPLNPTSVLRDFMFTNKKRIGDIRKPGGRKEDWRNVFLYPGMAAVVWMMNCAEVKRRKRFHLQSWLLSRGKPTERNIDSYYQDFPGLLFVCLQGSVHFNAPSVFLPSLATYCTSVFVSATRSLALGLFFCVLSQISITYF